MEPDFFHSGPVAKGIQTEGCPQFMCQRKSLQHNSGNERGRRNRQAVLSRFSRVVGLLALLIGGVAIMLAQHTVVEKNGLAGIIETDYNAAGKVAEMRTIGVDGKLQQKVQYEYLPGHYVADQTDTTYWPSGQVRKVVRKTY